MLETWCDDVKPLMDAIHAHPFNQTLASGTLSSERFIYYIQQDALYLADFSRALAITAGRITDNDYSHALLHYASAAMQAEKELHATYLQQYAALDAQIYSSQVHLRQGPACFMYTNYLLRMASLASVEESVASLLPCFWVYQEVGKKIAGFARESNPYYAWITLYASDAFELSVAGMMDMTNALACSASVGLQEKMQAAFHRATQLEWFFWEGAYTQNQWFPSC